MINGLKALGDRQVFFVTTSVSGIDRGWDPYDVNSLLESKGVKTRIVDVRTLEELDNLIDGNADALYWPVCYTISGDAEQKLVVRHLEQRGVKFVGASSKSLLYSSKIEFKKRARALNLSTPDFRFISERIEEYGDAFEYPVMLKTEFSCNSEGVRKASSPKELIECHEELTSLYNQKHYLERWEREAEYTVSYLPSIETTSGVLAPVGLKILSDASYIDVPTKASSPLVELSPLEREEEVEITQFAERIVSSFKLDGHCRIDLLRNSDGRLFALEINFLPFMSIREITRSYFPNALLQSAGVQYEDQIGWIIEHAVHRSMISADEGADG